MEETDGYAGIPAETGEFGLRALQGPLAGENSGVFVRVAIPDHHLLGERTRVAAPIPCEELQAPPRVRLLEKLLENTGCSGEIVACFEERHYGQHTDRSFRQRARQSSFAGKNVNEEQVAGAACHADDQPSQTVRSKLRDLPREHAKTSEHSVSLGSRRGACVQEGARGLKLFLEESE